MLKPMNNLFVLDLIRSLRAELEQLGAEHVGGVTLLTDEGVSGQHSWQGKSEDLEYKVTFVDKPEHGFEGQIGALVSLVDKNNKEWRLPLCEMIFSNSVGVPKHEIIALVQESVEANPPMYHFSADGQPLLLQRAVIKGRGFNAVVGDVKVSGGSARNAHTGEFLGQAVSRLSAYGCSERMTKVLIERGGNNIQTDNIVLIESNADNVLMVRTEVFGLRRAWTPEHGTVEQALIDAVGGPAWINLSNAQRVVRRSKPRLSSAQAMGPAI